MDDPSKFAFLNVYRNGDDLRQRISEAMAALDANKQRLEKPPAAFASAAMNTPAPPPQNSQVPQPQPGAIPMPPQRPDIPQSAPQTMQRAPQIAAMLAGVPGQAGQPMNILPDGQAMTFAGTKGPQWTDAQYQNFWNRVGNNG